MRGLVALLVRKGSITLDELREAEVAHDEIVSEKLASHPNHIAVVYVPEIVKRLEEEENP